MTIFNLKIGQLNADHRREPALTLQSDCEKAGIQILLLQEPYYTTLPNGTKKVFGFTGVQVVESPSGDGLLSAVIVLDKRLGALTIADASYQNIAVIEVGYANQRLILASVYASPNEALEPTIAKLEAIADKFRASPVTSTPVQLSGATA